MKDIKKATINLFRRLSSQGKTANIYDKFNSLLLTNPEIGEYNTCKECDAETPHIEGECQLCGTCLDYPTFTYTDTFGGQPNFAWARRVVAKDIRQAKKKLGLSGVRFNKEYNGTWNERNACRCILSDED